MRSLIGILALLCLVSSYTFGQNYSYLPQIKQVKIDRYQALETRSAPYRNRQAYTDSLSGYMLSQPLSFVRLNVQYYPKPVVRYFFTQPDSIVRRIDLEIDSMNFVPQDKQAAFTYKEPRVRMDNFNAIYDAIHDEMILHFGLPREVHEMHKSGNSPADYVWQREDIWENDSVSIRMYMIFSDNSQPTGDYRITSSIVYRNKARANKYSRLSFDGNARQDSLAQAYLQQVFTSQYLPSWAHVDDQLKKHIQYDDYTRTMTTFTALADKHGRDIELYTSGINYSPVSGETPYYSYRFKQDKSNPPSVTVNIVFRDKKSLKIVGMWPRELTPQPEQKEGQ